MSFLRELLDSEGLSRVKLPKINDFDIGFTHFISINHKPNQETIEAIWERRGAIHFKRNQQGADLGLIIKHRTTSQFGAIVFQVCNIGTYFSIGFRSFLTRNFVGQELGKSTKPNTRRTSYWALTSGKGHV